MMPQSTKATWDRLWEWPEFERQVQIWTILVYTHLMLVVFIYIYLGVIYLPIVRIDWRSLCCKEQSADWNTVQCKYHWFTLGLRISLSQKLIGSSLFTTPGFAQLKVHCLLHVSKFHHIRIDFDRACTVATSSVHSRLDYCNSMYYCLSNAAK